MRPPSIPRPRSASSKFERVFISYALSMIPPWREALARAGDVVEPDGALMSSTSATAADCPAFFAPLSASGFPGSAFTRAKNSRRI